MSNEHQLTEPERVSPSDTTVPDLQVPSVWPPAQQTFRRRSTFPVWATILLILLAFALIIGGLGLIFYTTTLNNGFSAAITTGLKQTNQLAVVAYKNILYLYVKKITPKFIN